MSKISKFLLIAAARIAACAFLVPIATLVWWTITPPELQHDNGPVGVLFIVVGMCAYSTLSGNIFSKGGRDDA